MLWRRMRRKQYILRLYVAGNNPRSQTAVENVKKICEDYLKGRYDLEVIDIYQDHQRTWSTSCLRRRR